MERYAKYFFLFLIIPSIVSAQLRLRLQSQKDFFQSDSLNNHKLRKIILTGGSAILASGSLIYLNQVWYKQYSTGKFHFFDDSREWLQMDKAGHVLTNFQISNLMMGAFKWAGFRKKQQLAIGGTTGFAYMTVIEVMDGYSSGWGFSWSDMAANAIGTGLAIGQRAMWDEQRINLKFSFHRTQLAKYRPDLLGSGLSEELLKDYNGQTYWVSVSPFCFFNKEKKLPRWLAISFGYGGRGMLGAKYNSIVVTDEQGNVISFDRERNFYLSLDIDFSKIRTRSKVLKAVLNTLNIVKVPFPAIGFMRNNGTTTFSFNSFYF